MLSPEGPNPLLSGPTAATRYPPGTVTLDAFGNRVPSSVCLAIHLRNIDREKRQIILAIGTNPAIPKDDGLVRRKIMDSWSDIRNGVELAIIAVAQRGHPLPIEQDAILFVMGQPPATSSERAIVTVDFDFGQRRREIIATRDAFLLYQRQPWNERVVAWYHRLFDLEEERLFQKRKFVAETVAKSIGEKLERPTPGEQYIGKSVSSELLKAMLIKHLSNPVQSLFAALFANDRLLAVELLERGRTAGAMTTVNIAEDELVPATDEVPLPPIAEPPPNMTLISLDDGPSLVADIKHKPPPVVTTPIVRADTVCTSAPEPAFAHRPPGIVQLKGKKPIED